MNKTDIGKQEACSSNNEDPYAYQGSKNPYYNKDEAKFITIAHLPHISEYQKLYAVTFPPSRLITSPCSDVIYARMRKNIWRGFAIIQDKT